MRVPAPPHPAYPASRAGFQLSRRLVDPFCQPLPYAHKAFVADRADAADKQFAVEDGEARQAEETGDFQAGVGKVDIGGCNDFIEPCFCMLGLR